MTLLLNRKGEVVDGDSFDCQKCRHEIPLEDLGGIRATPDGEEALIELFCAECAERMVASGEVGETDNVVVGANKCEAAVHDAIDRLALGQTAFLIRT